MKKMKQNLMAIATVMATSFAFATMTFAGSSNYSFTLDHRVVDGSDNGTYHSLDKGTAYIDGGHYEYLTDKGALSTYNNITYVLYRSRFGPDKSCGSIECDYYTNPSGKIGTADEKSSKYYLQIYKVEDDGHNIKGSGTIYN